MGCLLSDLRYAIRVLRKTPGFTVVSLITLALAIGANTAVFSVMNAVLLRPLPYPGAQDIVALFEKRTQENTQRGPFSAPDFVDWRRQAKSFSSMAVYDPAHFSITGSGGPERVPGTRVSAGFFEALGVRPFLGRTFEIAEEQPGYNSVAILSYGMWQRRLGGDRGVLSTTIGVNGAPYRIAGVLPQGFRFPFAPDSEVFVPVRLEPDPQFRGVHQFSGIARVKPGVTPQQAQAEMDLISRQLELQYPDVNTGHAANLIPLRTELSWQLEPALRVLLGAVILVALIACANMANLLLARASSRRRLRRRNLHLTFRTHEHSNFPHGLLNFPLEKIFASRFGSLSTVLLYANRPSIQSLFRKCLAQPVAPDSPFPPSSFRRKPKSSEPGTVPLGFNKWSRKDATRSEEDSPIR